MAMFEDFVPEWGWLCTAKACKNNSFIRNRADERRYRTILYKKAQLQMGTITDYICRDGHVYTVIANIDAWAAKCILNAANANYGKYKRLTVDKGITFEEWAPSPIPTKEVYTELKEKIFKVFYVADGVESGV